jgi:hypothetical protein
MASLFTTLWNSPACSCVSITLSDSIVNANHGIMRLAEMLRVSDCVADRVCSRPLILSKHASKATFQSVSCRSRRWRPHCGCHFSSIPRHPIATKEQRIAVPLDEMEQEIAALRDATGDSETSRKRRKQGLDNIQKLLDIIHAMNPQI